MYIDFTGYCGPASMIASWNNRHPPTQQAIETSYCILVKDGIKIYE